MQISIGTQCTFDHFDHTFQILVHISVGDAYDMETEIVERRSAGAVTDDFGFGTVCDAIDFDDEFSIQRNEIDNVSGNRVLAAEFPSRKPAITQSLPQPRLRACLLRSEPPCS